MRAPLWLILLIVLAIIGLGVYGYFTTPLPLGLGQVIKTPGGTAAAATPVPIGVPAGSRTPPGQPLVLGSTTVTVQAVQRAQDLTANNRGGPVGTYAIVQVDIRNGGSEPLSAQAAAFRLLDDRGRTYVIDNEATRLVNASARHRTVVDAAIPPGGGLVTLLAFETAPDANVTSLRVQLGYGEVELPR